ncbi:hypothetical protein MYX65_11670 [Acidobacteria bacterium AH-259-L09]|nr:hypothetical protein [Acidobacteria bacterium AH-259-L09]
MSSFVVGGRQQLKAEARCGKIWTTLAMDGFSELKVRQSDVPADERLDSWKEIATYLDRDVRTVQRSGRGLLIGTDEVLDVEALVTVALLRNDRTMMEYLLSKDRQLRKGSLIGPVEAIILARVGLRSEAEKAIERLLVSSGFRDNLAARTVSSLLNLR